MTGLRFVLFCAFALVPSLALAQEDDLPAPEITGPKSAAEPNVGDKKSPGDRKAVDPHPVLLAWQDRRTVPAGGWLARYGDDTAPRPGALTSVRDFIADG